MSNFLRLMGVLILSVVLVASCSKATKNKEGNGKMELTSLDYTPKDNEEAELIALCLSGKLVAPDTLYNRILNDLASIRSVFGDSFEIVNQLKFTSPWVAGSLIIGLDSMGVRLLRLDEYHAWDSLNQMYEVIHIDTSAAFDWLGIVVLTFKGRLHPYRLAEMYATLPGVWAADPNGRIFDFPNIYARPAQDGNTYLFRNAWDDCPSGCISNEYWYFVINGSQPALVGYWAQYEDPQVPVWWEEAKLNKEQYCEP